MRPLPGRSRGASGAFPGREGAHIGSPLRATRGAWRGAVLPGRPGRPLIPRRDGRQAGPVLPRTWRNIPGDVPRPARRRRLRRAPCGPGEFVAVEVGDRREPGRGPDGETVGLVHRLERVAVPRSVRGDVRGFPGLQPVVLPERLEPQLQKLLAVVLHQERHRVPQPLDRLEAKVPGLGHVRLQRTDDPVDVRPLNRVLFVHVSMVTPPRGREQPGQA